MREGWSCSELFIFPFRGPDSHHSIIPDQDREASLCQHTFTSLAQRNMRVIFVAARVDDEDFCHSEFSHCPNIVLWQNEENIWIKWKNIWIKCYVDANILRTAIIVQSKHGGPIYSTLPLNPGPGIGSMLTNLLNWMIAKWFNHQQQYYLSIHWLVLWCPTQLSRQIGSAFQINFHSIQLVLLNIYREGGKLASIWK